MYKDNGVKQLESGVKPIFASETYKDLLNTYSQSHNYSLNCRTFQTKANRLYLLV